MKCLANSKNLYLQILLIISAVIGVYYFVYVPLISASTVNISADVSIVCGNNVTDSGETCDGTDLAGEACSSQGFKSGALACSGDCLSFDTSSCVAFQCDDGIDNDGDGLTDYPVDPGCSSATDDDESDEFECSDGVDNDGDGRTDFPNDPGCSSTTDDDESDESQCQNNFDDDGDGLTDYPADPGCVGPEDNDETDTVWIIIPPAGGSPPSPVAPPAIKPPVISPPEKLIGDFNNDNLCNIVDFSIMLYYFDKPIDIAKPYDLNNDGKLNIVDVLILLFYWV